MVRYGNVFGSRGSIVKLLKNSEPRRTHAHARRHDAFWIPSIEVSLVLTALENMHGGEIFIPNSQHEDKDFMRVLAGGIRIVGIRPGEKLHETLVTLEDSTCGA